MRRGPRRFRQRRRWRGHVLEDTELAALSGPEFVSAITGFSATFSTAEHLVSGYLTEDLHRHARRPQANPNSEPPSP